MNQNINSNGLLSTVADPEITPISPTYSRSATPLLDEPVRKEENTVSVKKETDDTVQFLGEVKRYKTREAYKEFIQLGIARGYAASELLKPAIVSTKKKQKPKVLYLNSKIIMLKCARLHLLCEAIISVLRDNMGEGDRVNLDTMSLEGLHQLDMLLEHTFTDFGPTSEPEVEWNQDKFIKISEIWEDTTQNSALEMCESLYKAGEWDTTKSQQQTAKEQILIDLQIEPHEIKNALSKIAATMVITPFVGDFVEMTEEQKMIRKQGKIINSLTKELERLKDENKNLIQEKEAVIQKMEENYEKCEKVADSNQQAIDDIIEMRMERDKHDASMNAKIDSVKKQHAEEYKKLQQAKEEACSKWERDYQELHRQRLEVIKQAKRIKDDKDDLTAQLASKSKEIESLLDAKTGWATKYKTIDNEKRDLRARLNAKLRKESVIITKAELEDVVSGAVKRSYNEAHKPQSKRNRSDNSSHTSSHISSNNGSDKATTTVKKS